MDTTGETYVKTNIKIGKGAFSVVYKGFASSDGRTVAIKKYTNIKAQRREDKLKDLKIENHDNVIQILEERDLADSKSYVVIEYCNGHTVEEYMKKTLECQFGMTVDTFHKALLDISAGYKHLHDHKLAHRDIKPASIMMNHVSDGSTIFKLGNLGSSKVIPDDDESDPSKQLKTVITADREAYLDPCIIERYTTKVNTPFYRKTKKERYDKNVDLWSIGCTLVYIACNCFAFSCPADVKDKLTTVLQMTKGRGKHHIMSMLEHDNNIQHSDKFRGTSPMHLTASENLQKIYKDIICYCFSDGEKRETTVYFEKVEAVRKQELCYFVDLNQAYGYYDMLDGPVIDADTTKFAVKAVSQFASLLKSGIKVYFLSTNEKKCVVKDVAREKYQITNIGSNRDQSFNQCKTFESSYHIFDKVMLDLQIIDQLAFVSMTYEKYHKFEEKIQAIYKNHKKVIGLHNEILDIWSDLKPLIPEESKAVSVKEISPILLKQCKESNDDITKLVFDTIKSVYGYNGSTGFLSTFCELLLKQVDPAHLRNTDIIR